MAERVDPQPVAWMGASATERAKARCGGPGLCSQCAMEAAEAAVERAQANRLIPVEKWADDLANDLSKFTD